MWDFYCKGCVRERVWRLMLILKIKRILQEACEKLTREIATCWAHDWNAKSHDRWSFRECLTSKAFPQNTRKTFCFAILSFVFYQVFTHTVYTLITHILKGVLYKEKTLVYTLESYRLLYPQSSTHSLVVFLYSYLSISKSLRGW